MELFTIGNGNRSFKRLLPILQEAKIDVILDVRAIRSSWSGSYVHSNFQISLGLYGIAYYWYAGLGNPAHFLSVTFEKDKKEAARLKLIERYGEDIKMGYYDGWIRSICYLLEDSPEKRFCLFCAEKDAIKNCIVNCHRVYIAHHISLLQEGKGVRVDVTHL